MFVHVFAKQAERSVVAFGDQRREFEPRNVEQEYVHRVAEPLPDRGLAEMKLANECPQRAWRLVVHGWTIQLLQNLTVDARRDCQQLIGRHIAVSGPDLRHAVIPVEPGHQLAHYLGAYGRRQVEKVAIESSDSDRFGLFRPVAPVDRGDTHFLQGRLDLDLPDVGMQDVGFDAPLHYCWRQIDAFGCQQLNQRLGNHAPTVVAAGGPAAVEEPRLVDIDRNMQASGLGHPEQEIGEERAGGAASDHTDSGTVRKRELPLLLLEIGGKIVLLTCAPGGRSHLSLSSQPA
ncbi:MAG: hypothetical protein EPO19_14490 [Betaproteobacteria bacterium]|nr:MAG: hypothetical protein EPO19_14490 [Betaproteobacteria bacterium]